MASVRARGHAPAVLALAAAIAYSTLSIARHETFRSTGFDLGLFDQVVWHLSNLEAPVSSLKDLHSILGDHFSPVLVLFAPLYWLWSDPDMLLVAQAVLISAAAIPIHRFAAPRIGDGPALGVVTGYLLFGGVQSAIWFDFHEVAAAPLLIAGAVLLADRERWLLGALTACGLLLVKEDLSFLVIAFGAYFAILGQWRIGLTVVGAGIGWYLVATTILIPHFADGATYSYWSYTQLGPDAPHALANVLKAPWKLLDVGLTPHQKIRTTAYLFGAYGGLTLLSPVAVLSVPLLAERMLSTNANYWTLHAHYSLTIAPVLALGAADGLPRALNLIKRSGIDTGRGLLPAAGAMAAIAIVLIPAFPLSHLVQPSAYRDVAGARGAAAALALVPANASVSASNHLVPHLAHRDDVRLLGPDPPTTDFVVAEVSDPSNSAVFPNTDLAAVHRLLESATGYRTIYSRDGTVVLARR